MSLAYVLESREDYGIKHDAGYKYLLSDKRTFLSFLESFFDVDWVSKIDEHKVTRIDKSFILQDFKNLEADLVYQLSLANHNIIFYLLLELQASVDYTMPFRLLQYMVEIRRSYAKDLNITNKEFRLPVIVPCVLYNGQKKWTACQSFGDYQKGFQFFKEHALDFRYLLIDVKRYRQEKLFALDNLMAKVFFIEQFPSFTEILKGIKEIAPTLSKLPTEDTDKFLKVFSYFDQGFAPGTK